MESSTGKQKILFVDDVPMVHETHKRALRHRTDVWDMAFETSALAALDSIGTREPDVAVIDLVMPEMNGVELAAAIRERSPKTQCIMVTGSTDFDAAIALINEGNVFRFYVKPCPADRLIAGIEDALEASRQHATSSEQADGVETAALDAMNVGVLALDPDRHLLFTNRIGGQVLSAKDGLFLDPVGGLRAARAADSEALNAAMEDLLASGVPQGLTVERPGTGAPLHIVATQSDMDADRVFLFLRDPASFGRIPPATIATVFSLTNAEARLVSALAAGLDLDDAAGDCGVTKSTARSYLKQVFAKTGASRQAELVARVLNAIVAA